MTSAVASNMIPAAAAPAAAVSSSSSYGWLGPHASFSRDAAAAAEEMTTSVVSSAAVPATLEPAISKDFIDFEFSLGGCATMLPADELFADGKLLPLRKAAAAVPEQPEAAAAPPPPRSETMPAAPEQMKPLRAAADAADAYVFSPRAPSCSSRWRELLGLERSRAAAQSPKPSPTQAAAPAKNPGRTANSSSVARSLKFLLQRSNGRASSAAASDLASAPLLRDSSDSEASLSLASSRFSLSSSSSSSGHDHDDIPRLSLDSADPNPPRLRLVRSSHSHSTSSRAGRSPARRRPSPPPPPRCLSVDSPRMNSSGKIVFQSLERSCSSPCSFHAASKARARAVERSYSSGVRVAPVVLNVPVCSRPVFGFFKDKKESAAKDSAAARSRSSTLGRKATPQPQPQRWSGELPKLSGW